MAKRLISYLVILALIGLSSPHGCQNIEILRKGQLTCEDKKTILHAHNKLRQKVASGNGSIIPPGINILEMSWDDGLANSAQIWAENCYFLNTVQHEGSIKRFYAGQNVAMTTSQNDPPKSKDKPEFEKEIQSWYDEVQYYNGFFTYMVGHFIQLIWDDTNLVGCGYVYFKQEHTYYKLYICNYHPAGNIWDMQPYTKGTNGCNSSQVTASINYQGLCKSRDFRELNCN